MNNFPELAKRENCTGCLACFNICPQSCIVIEEDNEGFNFPKILYELCLSCHECIRVCPVINPIKNNNYPQPTVYASFSLNKDERTSSSSGGLFPELAKSVLYKDGVVYGAEFDHNLKLSHQRVDDSEYLYKLKESKYLQSYIGTSFREVRSDIKKNRIVLFVGTPCQVAGLNLYLKTKKANINNFFSIDLVCHGVPSQRIFENYINKLQQKYKEKIIGISFRNISGWGLKTTIKTQKKTIHLKGYYSYYLKAFLNGYVFRKSCYNCLYAKLPRGGDITLGDFWGIENCKPSYEITKGVSLVMVNNLKGKELLNNISSKVFLEERYILDAIEHNQNITRPSLKVKERESFISDNEVLSLRKIGAKYNLKDRKISKFLKNKITTVWLKFNSNRRNTLK